MLETVFEAKCIKALRALPNSHWPDKVDALSVRGIPDRVGCVSGRYVAIEFKKDITEFRKKTGRIVLQKYTLLEISKAGGYTFVAYPDIWPGIFNEIKILF